MAASHTTAGRTGERWTFRALAVASGGTRGAVSHDHIAGPAPARGGGRRGGLVGGAGDAACRGGAADGAGERGRGGAGAIRPGTGGGRLGGRRDARDRHRGV